MWTMPEFDPDALRRVMRDAKVLNKDLAEALKITPSHLSRVRTGKKPCPRPLAERLADKLGVPVDVFYPPAEAEKLAGPMIDLSAAERAAMEALAGLPTAIKGPMVNCLLGLAAGTTDGSAQGAVPSGPPSPEYWQRRSKQLRDMLTEADRRHNEAVRREEQGGPPPAVPEP